MLGACVTSVKEGALHAPNAPEAPVVIGCELPFPGAAA